MSDIRHGGNAAIQKQLAEEHLSMFLAPSEFYYMGPKMQKVSAKGISEKAKQHAPTPKQRMRIIKRDNYSCRICGRSPCRNVDIELHVHHIIPWGSSIGLTVNENLITLCHTCHKGLDPHEDKQLFYLNNNEKWSKGIATPESLLKGMILYRDLISRPSIR